MSKFTIDLNVSNSTRTRRPKISKARQADWLAGWHCSRLVSFKSTVFFVFAETLRAAAEANPNDILKLYNSKGNLVTISNSLESNSSKDPYKLDVTVKYLSKPRASFLACWSGPDETLLLVFQLIIAPSSRSSPNESSSWNFNCILSQALPSTKKLITCTEKLTSYVKNSRQVEKRPPPRLEQLGLIRHISCWQNIEHLSWLGLFKETRLYAVNNTQMPVNSKIKKKENAKEVYEQFKKYS